MKSKKLYLFITVLMTLSLLLGACGSPEAPAAEPEEAAPVAEVEEEAPAPSGDVVKAESGQEVNMVLLPKFLGILVFDQANDGAQEAHSELENPGELQFLGPTPENSVAGQIEIVTTATTQGMDAIMISNIRSAPPPKPHATPA